MSGRFVRGLLAVAAGLGACAAAGDGGAQTSAQHAITVTLSFGGTRYQGTSTGVNIVETAVNGAMQYRVNVLGNFTGKPGLCTIAVSSGQDASRLKNDLVDPHAAAVTCAVSHAVTTDPTSGVFVFLNTLAPSAGDSLTVESH